MFHFYQWCREGDEDVASSDLAIWISARIFYYFFCLSYNNCYWLYIQIRTSGAVVVRAWKLLQDLGSNPRSPKYFIFFPSRWSSVYMRLATTMVHHNPKRQVSWRPDPRAMMGGTPWSHSQHATLDFRSQRGLPSSWAQILLLAPPLFRRISYSFSFYFISFN